LSDQKIELERVYTVPLSRAWITARHKRTPRALHILREFAEKHMKSAEIKIDTDLNEEIWKRGITKPPRRITVKMEKDEDGVVTISLPKEAKAEAVPEVEEKPVEKVEEAAPKEPERATLPAPVKAAAVEAPVEKKVEAPEKEKETPAKKKAAAPKKKPVKSAKKPKTAPKKKKAKSGD
jgi:large subunit ribosomal protein L31e